MTTKPKTFYFAGQWSFGNRGCEALIRSNVKLIRELMPDARFLCPSMDSTLDRRQWPDAESHGVEFVPIARPPAILKAWNKLHQLVPAISQLGRPPAPADSHSRHLIAGCDALLMTGGDILSLDYGLLSLNYWVGLVEAARRLGKPTHLLAASVGPFSKDPVVERQMVRHLQGYVTISVRETASFNYLKSIGIDGVTLVAEPAFVLDPEPWDVEPYLPHDRDHLGVNFSPLVRRVRKDEASRREFDEDIAAFIKSVLETSAMDVLLIPHSEPLAGTDPNSDRSYMQQLLDMVGEHGGRVRLLPNGLNAGQLKFALGRCRYFIGARTHATVGSISRSVPTLSIAYSVKAVGINEDLFGSTRYVLPTPEVTRATLAAGLAKLQADETAIKAGLDEKLPLWRNNARGAIAPLVA